MTVPTELQYTENHEWVRNDGDVIIVGITEFAAESLGDVVYVQLPEVGNSVSRGETCGEIESTKSVSDLYTPADGQVLEVNEAVMENPSLVNDDPFGNGWLFKLRPTALDDLLDADSYSALISS
jgi:glycine cleavage system H protein